MKAHSHSLEWFLKKFHSWDCCVGIQCLPQARIYILLLLLCIGSYVASVKNSAAQFDVEWFHLGIFL